MNIIKKERNSGENNNTKIVNGKERIREKRTNKIKTNPNGENFSKANIIYKKLKRQKTAK